MEVASTYSIPVTESSQVGEARRVVTRLAERRGLDETAAGRAALVVTELAGNLVKHTAQGGEILIRPIDDRCIEVLALDRGQGMESVSRCLQDGFSTAGSPGTGLGAVSRLSDTFQVFSSPGAGTAILARVGARSPAPVGLEVGVVSRMKPGQEVCGDGWAAAWGAEHLGLMVSDGLGHGPGAAEASTEAVRSFLQNADRAPAEVLDRMHGALRSTRGAAVAVAEVHAAAGEVRFAAVGNIAGVILDGSGSRSTISHNGIVGHEMRRVQQFSYPYPPDSVLLLHSDGLSGRWDLGRYPGLLARDPALIAGVLYRDFGRESDDATVAVVRRAGPVGGMAP